MEKHLVMRVQVPMSSLAMLHLLLVTLPCMERGPSWKRKLIFRSRIQCCSWLMGWAPMWVVRHRLQSSTPCPPPTLLHVPRQLETLVITDLL